MSLLSIFSFAMSLVYVGAGLFLLLGKNIFNFNNFQRIGLSIILLAYGSFRFYKTLKKIRDTEEEDES